MSKSTEPKVSFDPSSLPEDRPRPSAKDEAQDQRIRTCAIEAARLMHDEHCEEVLLFDVRGASQITDYILVGTGTSDRQMRAVGHHVADMAREYGLKRYGVDQDGSATWIVVDFVDIMVHLFEPATRAHYDLEMMWGDAPQIRWRRTA